MSARLRPLEGRDSMDKLGRIYWAYPLPLAYRMGIGQYYGSAENSSQRARKTQNAAIKRKEERAEILISVPVSPGPIKKEKEKGRQDGAIILFLSYSPAKKRVSVVI